MYVDHPSDPPTSSFRLTDNVDPESDRPILSSIGLSNILSWRPIFTSLGRVCYQGAMAEPVLQNHLRRLHCIPCQISRCSVAFGRTVSMTTLYAFCELWTRYTVAYLVDGQYNEWYLLSLDIGRISHCLPFVDLSV